MSDSSIPPEAIIETTKPSFKPRKKIWLWIFGLLSTGILLLLIVYTYVLQLNKPTTNFPISEPIVIETGASVTTIAAQLEAAGVVRSKDLLYYTLVLLHDPSSIKASTYVFAAPLTTAAVAQKLTEGAFDTDLIRFTHFEGERAEQLAARAVKLLPQFNRARFLTAATPLEGHLYPDTYFIPANYTDEDLLTLLTKTFDEHIADLDAEIASSSLSLKEILTLASIIEREANTPESMKLVSGVLQNRLSIGMALQADASIEYVLDKPLADLTSKDLETIDSPYNTYKYTGLPPTPIGNPGLDAITAVLKPTESDYYYYLTNETGTFYYAKTYREHLVNIEKYLQ